MNAIHPLVFSGNTNFRPVCSSPLHRARTPVPQDIWSTIIFCIVGPPWNTKEHLFGTTCIRHYNQHDPDSEEHLKRSLIRLLISNISLISLECTSTCKHKTLWFYLDSNLSFSNILYSKVLITRRHITSLQRHLKSRTAAEQRGAPVEGGSVHHWGLDLSFFIYVELNSGWATCQQAKLAYCR